METELKLGNCFKIGRDRAKFRVNLGKIIRKVLLVLRPLPTSSNGISQI